MPFSDVRDGGRSNVNHDISSHGISSHDNSGADPFLRPECVSGFEPSGSGSTSLKWGSDGELNPLDLHKVLARLCLHDPQIYGQLDDGAGIG
jgi:hypothetical protein